MGESLTVRLFVQTQTYDIPCDPRQPAEWLLMQAKKIQRANNLKRANPPEPNSHNDELEVLYNRTTRSVIELGDQIGRCISPMDVVDARTLLQTPDTTFNSALFPWLRSYPGGLQLSEDSMNSTNGLFFQQLYAYTLIGKRTPMPASQRKEKQNKEAFHSLLEVYVRGSFDASKRGSQNGYGYQQQHTPQHAQYSAHRPVPLTPATPARDAQGRRLSDRPPSGATPSSQYKTAQSPSYTPPPRRLEFPPERGDTNSSSDSDNAEDNIPLRVNASIPNSPYHNSASKYRGANGVASPTSPSLDVSSSPMRRASNENPLDEMENVFDIVFKQQAIGMKLGADETKQFAVVKECFDNSEAARYPEIQNGVVILAVNGQECAGLGLSRILYRLREAPRPVVVRFGRISNKQQLSGTWGSNTSAIPIAAAAMRSPPSVFVADDKFFDVIRCLEARGWRRHPHLSFPKFRLKWTNYSRIPWTAARAAAAGSNRWLNHFQHAVLFSQKDVFAHALYDCERSAAAACIHTQGGGVDVDGFYLRTFDLLRDDDTQLLREWFVYSSALAILKSCAVHPTAHDGAIEQVVAACSLLTAVTGAGAEFFSRARTVAILDAGAPQWKALMMRNRQSQGGQAPPVDPAPRNAAVPCNRHVELKSQVERILQQLRTLDTQFEAVGVENQSVWICKPSNLSQGRGIQLLTSLDDILALQTTQDSGNEGIAGDEDQSSPSLAPKSKWVVQKYMEQPLLSLQGGRKFDIRQWVLISSLQPLRVFWYHKCYLRFCSEPFGLERERLDDQFVHLSNFSIQKNAAVATAAAAAAAESGDETELEAEMMWSSDRFQDHLRQEHGGDVWNEVIVPQMQHATRIAILSTVSKLKAVGKGFEWLGLDFLLDASHRVWLLEVNVSPDVSHSTSVTAELVPQATEHLLQLVLDEPLAPGNGWLPLTGFF